MQMCNYIPLKISAILKTLSMHGDATFFHQYFYGDIPTGKCFMQTKSLSILQVPCIEMLTIFTHRYSKDVVGMCMSCRGKDSRCKTLHGLLIKIYCNQKATDPKSCVSPAATQQQQNEKASIITCLYFATTEPETCVAYTAT